MGGVDAAADAVEAGAVGGVMEGAMTPQPELPFTEESQLVVCWVPSW